MSEWLMIACMLWSGGLMAAGGTHIPGIGGQKWLRRYLLPAGLGAVALFYAPWWAILGYTATLSAFLCMGYGDRASWLYRAFIFAGYGAASLWLGWSWWVVITPVVCAVLFALSNNRLTERAFVWKIAEVGMGFLIGAAFIAAILNQWRGV